MALLLINIIVAIFSMATICFATSGIPLSTHWIPAGWGGGGTFNNVVYDKYTANRIYAMTDVGGGWISNNDGLNWTSFNGGSLTQGFPGTTTHLTFSEVSYLIQSDANPNMLVVNTGNGGYGLAESLDSGSTWAVINNNISCSRTYCHSALALDHSNTNIIYAGDDSGNVWVTQNNGTSWNILTHAGSNATNNIGSAGQSTLSASLNVYGGSILPGTVTITDTSEIWKDDGSGHLTSNLSGYTAGSINYGNGAVSLTWTNHIPNFQPVATYQIQASIKSMALSQDNTTLYIGTASRLKVYNVTNNTYVDQTFSGNTSNYINNINDIKLYSFNGNNYVVVSAGLALAYSINDGTTWSYSTNISNPLGNSADIYHFDAQPYNGSVRFWVYVLYPGDTGHNTSFYTSDNMGGSWTGPISYTSNDDYVNSPTRVWEYGSGDATNFLSVNPFNPTEAFGGDAWGMWQASNSGAVWNERIVGAQNQVLTDIEMDPMGCIWASGMDNGSFRTCNNGVTWSSKSPNGSSINNNESYGYFTGHHWKVAFAGTQQQWQQGQGTVVETMNPWVDVPTGNIFPTMIARSTQDGNPGTYVRLENGVFPIVERLYGMWGTGFFRSLGWYPGVSKIWAAFDGYAPGNQNVLYSSDQGATWQAATAQPSGSSKFYNALTVDPLDTTGCTVAFAAFDGGNEGASPYGTSNCGSSWNYLNNNLYAEFTVTPSSVSNGSVYSYNTGNSIINFTIQGSTANGAHLGGSWSASYPPGVSSPGVLTFVSGSGPATIPFTAYSSSLELELVYQIKFANNGKLYIGASNADLWFSSFCANTSNCNQSGLYGKFSILHHFVTDMHSPQIDALTFDPVNQNLMAVSASYPGTDGRVFMTGDLQDDTNSQWYDISGDLPCRQGSNQLLINPSEGNKGFIYAVTYGCGVFKLDLNDILPKMVHVATIGS